MVHRTYCLCAMLLFLKDGHLSVKGHLGDKMVAYGAEHGELFGEYKDAHLEPGNVLQSESTNFHTVTLQTGSPTARPRKSYRLGRT